jgi:transposase-like protein
VNSGWDASYGLDAWRRSIQPTDRSIPMKKVPASEATRKRLEQVFSSQEIDPGRIVREATRLMIEQALEAEVEQAVGRRYYTHGKGTEDDAPRALRNGVRRGRIDSAEGVIEFDASQVRGLSGWSSEVRAALAGKSEELTRLAVEMYARGLSMRDIEAAFTDEAGRCVLTRSAASAVCERLWGEYQAFAQRDLGELDIVYLFLDGVAERLHLGQPREARCWPPGASTATAPSTCWHCCRVSRRAPMRAWTSCAT